MLTAITLAAALVAAPVADKWAIKPDLTPKAKASWEVTVDAKVGSEEHQAKFTLVRNIGASSTTKSPKGVYQWTNLVVDGNSMGEDSEWEVNLDPRGPVTSSAAGDEYRRMLTPFSIAYPEAEVQVGDKWTFDVAPTKGVEEHKVTYSYEVKGIEKIKDTEVFKIASKMTEKGTDGMSSDGNWWVAKDGRVLRFEFNVKNWIVPMAGTDLVDASVRGESK